NTPPVIATTAVSGEPGYKPMVTLQFRRVPFRSSVTDPIDVQTAGPTATTGCGWTQSWTANVSDDCDNPAEQVTITYTWIVDNTPPVIATTAASGDLGCNPTVTAPTFTVTDNCSVTDPIDVQTAGPTATTGCGWTQSWTANVSDDCDNPAAPVTITYTWIVDNTPPQIATTATSGDLGCNPTVTAPAFTVTD